MNSKTARIAGCLLIALATQSACSGSHRRNNNFKNEQIRASSPQAQRMFDEGMTLIEQARWEEATTQFRLIQAQYPGDPIAVVAELFASRAQLGELDLLTAASAASASDGPLSALSQLAQSKEDDRVRWAAAAYYAAGVAAASGLHEGTSALGEYPSAAVSPVVAARDRGSLQFLVLEGHLAAGRFPLAVGAAGLLWDHAAASVDAGLQEFAAARAFEAATRMDTEPLLASTSADSPFQRAIAGITLLERRAPVADVAEARSLRDLGTRLAPDASLIGHVERLRDATRMLKGATVENGKLLIAVAVPLSGEGAAARQQIAAGRSAVDGALIGARAESAGRPSTTVVVVDANASDPKAELRALSQQGLTAVIGPLDQASATAWSQAAGSHGVLHFPLTARPLNDGHSDGWSFRWFIDVPSEAAGVARAAVTRQGDQRIAVLRPAVGYGRQAGEAFVTAAQAAGATIVLDEEYDPSATDYSRLANRVARLAPDAIFIPDAATRVGQVTAFLAQANVWGIPGDRQRDPASRRIGVHYLGTSFWNHPELLKHARSYVAGALIPAWSADAFAEPKSRDFFLRYQAFTPAGSHDVAAFAADAVGFLYDGHQSGATSPAALRDLLLDDDPYAGITGPTAFRASGEAMRTLRFITITNEQFVASPITIGVGTDGS